MTNDNTLVDRLNAYKKELQEEARSFRSSEGFASNVAGASYERALDSLYELFPEVRPSDYVPKSEQNKDEE